MKNRLTLEDFTLNCFESQNELEKMMGVADVAAACHESCNPEPPPYEFIDFVDHDQS